MKKPLGRKRLVTGKSSAMDLIQLTNRMSVAELHKVAEQMTEVANEMDSKETNVEMPKEHDQVTPCG